MRPLILLGLFVTASAVGAQTPGQCRLGRAEADLATPDLRARLFNTGALFYGNEEARQYVVPRSAGKSPIYASALWIGGRVDGEVRVAAGTYGVASIDYNFWPGPLDPGAVLPNPADCSAFDRIYVVAPADVAAYEAGGVISDDLREWPVGLGAPAIDAEGLPVVASSRDQRLDLPGGERPAVYGGPTAFWVMNDVGNEHLAAATAPLGVEVRVTAFAPRNGPAALRQSTFYRYTVVNRNAVPIDSLRLGFFVDADLGDAGDDYVGTDTTRGMAFTYNADNFDGTGTATSYGTPPPAVGYDLLDGLGVSSYFRGGSGGSGDPATGVAIYNYMQGLWGDGSVIRTFGDGHQETQGEITRFAFPGDPVTNQAWSEVNNGDTGRNAPGDRRSVTVSPAATLAPGASQTVDLAIVFAQGSDHLASITALRTLSDAVQAAHDDGTLFTYNIAQGTAAPPALVAPAENAVFYETDVTFSWEPVPGAEYYVVEVSPTADFADADIEPEIVTGTSATYEVSRFRANRTAPFYWRVRTGQGGLDGPPGASRSVRVYRYVAAPLELASGTPAFVEVTSPGGGPACDGPSDPDEGCSEVGGDLVFESPNSTGDYLVGFFNGLEVWISRFAPRDFEVRFTAAGSYAFTLGGGERRLFRVPFEVWDVGVVAPGTPNDPADDRQFVPVLSGYRRPAPGVACAFNFENASALDVGLSTPSVSVYYTDNDDYAAFEAAAAAAVAGAPDGCPAGAATTAAVTLTDTQRGSPLGGLFFEQAGTRTPADLAGSTVRFYTADRVVAADPAPAPGALALGAPFPNPAGRHATVPYSVGTAGPVRLRLVDVLGRTVGVLAEGPRAAGSHEARVDVGRLAAGVYAVVLDAGGTRAVRTLTVVR